ncbi:MAG: oligosaccharide flippase family protein, partial [Thermoproteota archaeon]
QGLSGIFLGRLFGDGVGVLMLLTFTFHANRLEFAWPVATAMVRYGLPLTWSALIGMMLDASGRYFLSHYSTMEQVGLYGVAIKISSVFQMLINQPFGVAWGGLMFQIVKWPNARFVYSKILSYLLVVSLSAALLFVLFTPLLFSIFATDSYAAATAVFPLVLLARAVQVMEYPTAIGIYLSGRTKHFALIYTIGLVSNIVANYVLTPVYGMFGAAWAWLIAWMLITSLMLWIGHRYYPLDYYWQLALIPVILWGLVFFNVWWLLPILSAHVLVQFSLAFVLIASVGLLLIRDVRVVRKKAAEERAV